MAFPEGWQRKCAIVIQAAQVAETLTDFPLLVTGDNFPAEIWANADDGGGDLRFSADDAGAVRLACEIVSFSTSGETAEIYVKVPSVSSAVNTTIYVWYSNTGQTQPAATDTYGSQAVWGSDYAAVYHFNQNPAGGTLLDSTGNENHGTLNGSFTLENGVSGNNSAFAISAGNYVTLSPAISYGPNQSTLLILSKTGGGFAGILHRAGDFGGVRADIYVYDSGSQYVQSNINILNTGYNSVFYSRNADPSSFIAINGIDRTGSKSGNPIVASINGLFWDYQLASNRFFAGSVDEIRLIKSYNSLEMSLTLHNNIFNPATFAIAGTPTAVSAFNPAWAKHSNQIIRAL